MSILAYFFENSYSKYVQIRTFLIYLLIFFSLLTHYGCNTTEPSIPIDQITSLEYDWEIDTLFNPNGYGIVPKSIWGSSTSDIWVAGYNLAGQGEMFHFDGLTWKRTTPDLGFNYELSAVWGFNENEVFVVGSKLIIDSALHTESLILRYNGINWDKETIPLGKGLLYIHGQNSNDIWACGFSGALYHKTGDTWQKMYFDTKLKLGPIWAAPSGEVFMMNEYYDYPVTEDTAMFYFSKYSSSNWNILDSCRLVNIDGIPTGYKFGEYGVFGISENEIYSAGSGLFKFDGSNWQVETWDDYDYNDIKCNEDLIFFVVGGHGTIRYLLNNQWQKIRDFSKYTVDLYSIMPFKNEIFIGAYSGGNGYIIHGKLKN